MKPPREHATNNQQTYFVSSQTVGRRQLFTQEPWANLFLESLQHYRESAYLLHEFVLMPDHFHLLITSKISLERAVQYIKGGFSHRAKQELQTKLQIWQRGFSDHRVRDLEDYETHRAYIRSNPVTKGLCHEPTKYPYSSAYGTFALDSLPQGLKPLLVSAAFGTAEAVPLQSKGNIQNKSDLRKIVL